MVAIEPAALRGELGTKSLSELGKPRPGWALPRGKTSASLFAELLVTVADRLGRPRDGNRALSALRLGPKVQVPSVVDWIEELAPYEPSSAVRSPFCADGGT